jgi:hypothetical protein
MIDSTAVFTNFSGAFPNIVGVNSSGPSTTDGTEFIKAFIDDIWGRFQAMLDYAALTPNGVTESATASQHIDAIKKGFGVGPGMGVIWWKKDDPSVTGDRVLLLNGQGILRANYADLDAEVYVGDANNSNVASAGGGFYRADNSDGTSPNIAGVYLIMPDTRGLSLKNIGDATINGRTKTGPVYKGEPQEDQGQGHYHAGYYGVVNASFSGGGTGEVSLQAGNTLAGSTSAKEAITDGSNGTPREGTNFRDSSCGTQYGITY